MTAILVSHPHVAPMSAEVASALAGRGALAGLAGGVAFSDSGRLRPVVEQLAVRWPRLRNRIVDGVAPFQILAHPMVEMTARLSSTFLHRLGSHFETYNALFTAHDLAVSWSRWPRNTTAVYAYEDGALRTFQRARRRNLGRIWDLPTPRYHVAEEVFARESARWPGATAGPVHREPPWKKERKDAELTLATEVIVASAFTRRSIESIACEAPVSVVPYGFPVDLFQPLAARSTGKFRVLSVGSHDLRKGTPYLLEAWRAAALPDAELHLIGPLRLSQAFVGRYAGLFRHTPHVARHQLPAHYASADLVVFPTLADGFGMVIQEALCCETPVLTTTRGGGPECLTDGVEGWIIPPGDVDALVDRLRDAARNRDGLREMGRRGRVRAERYTWRDAGAALIKALRL